MNKRKPIYRFSKIKLINFFYIPSKKVSTTKKMSLPQKKKALAQKEKYAKNKLLFERYRTFYGLFAKSKK